MCFEAYIANYGDGQRVLTRATNFRMIEMNEGQKHMGTYVCRVL